MTINQLILKFWTAILRLVRLRDVPCVIVSTQRRNPAHTTLTLSGVGWQWRGNFCRHLPPKWGIQPHQTTGIQLTRGSRPHSNPCILSSILMRMNTPPRVYINGFSRSNWDNTGRRTVWKQRSGLSPNHYQVFWVYVYFQIYRHIFRSMVKKKFKSFRLLG